MERYLKNPYRQQQHWMFFVAGLGLLLPVLYFTPLLLMDLLHIRIRFLLDEKKTIETISLFLASVSLGLFLVGGLPGLMMYPSVWKLERELKKIRDGAVLAKWSFTPEGWHDHLRKQMKASKEQVVGMFVPWTIVIVLGLFMLIKAPVVVLVLWGVSLLILGGMQALHAWHWWDAKRSLKQPPPTQEMIISEDLVIQNGNLYAFQTFGNRIQRAIIEPSTEETTAALRIEIFVTNGRFDNTVALHIPIPDGQLEKAQEIVNILKQKYGI